MEDDFLYEKDFDENVPYVQIDLGIEDVRQLYESLTLHSDNWVSSDEKKERIDTLRDFLNRLILEYKYRIEE
jgi:hypothetical protein